ncbi:hypothetical protein F4780DRAFT_789495 [Xylariomycetidae sp. FL0641]|nr:hypothetical protein F4780DRAFT_789495 [Xylariomycetidae sp. FL0641]
MLFWIVTGLLLHTSASLPSPGGQPKRRMSGVKLSQFHFDPFGLTNTCIDCSKDDADDPMFHCKIQFDFDDPNAGNTSCTCENAWEWDGVTMDHGPQNNYTTDYFVCEVGNQVAFQFKFDTMAHLSSFSLSLTHMFEDSKDFHPPTTANLFAKANITLPALDKSNTSIMYAWRDRLQAKVIGMVI